MDSYRCPHLWDQTAIADLAGSVPITQVHLPEALQYRPKLDLM